jgi:hypothetical protein
LNDPKGSLWCSQAPATDPHPVMNPIYTLVSNINEFLTRCNI